MSGDQKSVDSDEIMGCCKSKKIHPEPGKASDSSLSSADIEIIQDIWKIVEQDPQGNGLLLFGRLFEENPDVRTKFYFSVENNLNLEATMKDERLGKHAKGVIDTIGVAVAMLGDLSTLAPILKQLGAAHAKFNLQDEHFVAVGDALIWTLQKVTGTPLDNNAKEAWVKLFSVVKEKMKEGIRDMGTGGERD